MIITVTFIITTKTTATSIDSLGTIESGRAHTFRDFTFIHITCYDIPQEISSFFKVRIYDTKIFLHYVKELLTL